MSEPRPPPRLQRILLRQGFLGQARIQSLRSPLSREPFGRSQASMDL